MPTYIFQHPETEEIIEIIQSVHDKHEFVKDGIKWNRVFTKPQMAIDTQINPYDAKSFITATNKKGSVGDLMERSKELSEKRKNKDGVDSIKEQYYQNYSKERNGTKHPDVIKRESTQKLEKLGVKIEK